MWLRDHAKQHEVIGLDLSPTHCQRYRQIANRQVGNLLNRIEHLRRPNGSLPSVEQIGTRLMRDRRDGAASNGIALQQSGDNLWRFFYTEYFVFGDALPCDVKVRPRETIGEGQVHLRGRSDLGFTPN